MQEEFLSSMLLYETIWVFSSRLIVNLSNLYFLKRAFAEAERQGKSRRGKPLC